MLTDQDLYVVVKSLRPDMTANDIDKIMETAVRDRIWNKLAKVGLWDEKAELEWGESEDAEKVKKWIELTARTRLLVTQVRLKEGGLC
jgi:hypothetical protein